MKKNRTVMICAAGLCLASVLMSLTMGAAQISAKDLWNALISGPSGKAGYILWYARIPRALAAMLAGAALAVSGAVIQSVLNNRLASPGIIGINAGAGLSVTIACAGGLISGWSIAVSAFAGAMMSALLVVLIAKKAGASRMAVILAGVAMNSFLNALSEAITVLSPDAAMLSGDFRIGGFSSVSYERLLPAGAAILAALMIVMTLLNDLDVLSLGEETAHSLGMPVRRMQVIFLALAATLAGAAVSFAGILGFVGLLVPHAARRLVGSGNRKLIPLCAVGGAGFVTACDVLSRVLFAPYELPTGILMAVLGGPFFIVLLIRGRGGQRDA